MKEGRNSDLYKKMKSIREAISKGKVKKSIFLILNDLVANSMFKIIMVTVYSITCTYVYLYELMYK